MSSVFDEPKATDKAREDISNGLYARFKRGLKAVQDCATNACGFGRGKCGK